MVGCFESMNFCVSHTCFISFLLPLHQLYRHCLLRSCASLSGSDCRQFFRVQHCIPANTRLRRLWKFNNIFLSDAELGSLKLELPGKWEYYIDRLSLHIASSGKQHNNRAATIYKWAREDADKAAPKKGMPDYSYSEEDSL